MDERRYERFTDELVRRLGGDDRVVGLVALGSMAATSHPPDEWSDHDFWVITHDGRAPDLRGDTSWLPEASEVVLVVHETRHGRSAIYADGHLAEFAVFDERELHVARANAHRVLLDHGDVHERMQQLADRTTREAGSVADPFGVLLTQLTIGANRFARGERLSAHHLVRGEAVRTLIRLLTGRGDHPTTDNLDPVRRFEQRSPDLATEIEDATVRPIPVAAERLLSIAERECPERAEPAALAAVRATLARVVASTA